MTTWEEEVRDDALPAGLTQAWAAANPRSESLSRRARRVLPGGVTHDVRRAAPFPLAAARAEGAHKWDLDGHEIICYVMGHGALLLGHSDPEVVAAVRHQATLAFHPGACHELECQWAEAVVDLVPSAEVVRFTASGTEASLLALRLARAATGRERVVKLAGHFHGWHDQVSFGTERPFCGPDTAGVPGVLGQVVTVVPADAGALADALRDGDVAAVILEPSGAAWGTVPLPAGLLAAARDLTAASGTVLVFDEVVSGFRWSPGGVQAVAGLAAALRAGLTSVLADAGVPGCAYGDSSTFHLLIGQPGEPERASLQALKAGGMSPELSAELHSGMLLEGVHLFHGSGFLSAAHTGQDVERTVAAFAATLSRLPAGLLP